MEGRDEADESKDISKDVLCDSCWKAGSSKDDVEIIWGVWESDGIVWR